MPAFVAMLRGINVSGQKIVRMETLRRLCESLGFRSIETYVQSGNIVFLDSKKATSSIAQRISEAILSEFGFSITVLVKTAKEMKDVVENNPFVKERGIDQTKLHVTFLSDAAPKSALTNLEKLSGKRDRFHIGLQEIHLYCPDGYGKTTLSNTALERTLSVRATTRNWKTVRTLLEMASKLDAKY